MIPRFVPALHTLHSLHQIGNGSTGNTGSVFDMRVILLIRSICLPVPSQQLSDKTRPLREDGMWGPFLSLTLFIPCPSGKLPLFISSGPQISPLRSLRTKRLLP